MLAILQKAFAHAHGRTVAEFSNPAVLLWFPAERNGTTYTVRAEGMKGSLRPQMQGMGGLMLLPTDGLVINVRRDAIPYPAKIKDLMLIGPTLSGDATSPDVDACKTYCITAIGDTEINTHLRLTVELVA